VAEAGRSGGVTTAADYVGEPFGLIEMIAEALRSLHHTPIEGCPTDTGVGALVAEADARVHDGRVDPARFDAPFRRYPPADLLGLALRSRPDEPADAVLVHGSARLSSLAVVDGGAAGWFDLERCGVGDPYRDLATFAIDLADRVSPEILGPFLEAYGIERPELVRMDFHVLLDQLLR